ncbi:hypothetical protein [Burkholderia sp. TSV86]|uniref:hypothetical protein n=1 Tax=Burkholderia sp. TSV86 TaxID=1385594 RepID=UPI00075CF004|nr:hypothetical protein [Burkholderia sp. TSV86]KVE39481.1 hypothetical protein WS68_22320 [Burkholderia sp. TSV86]
MSIAHAILALFFAVAFTIVWHCIHIANANSDDRRPNNAGGTPESPGRNSFLENMLQDMATQSDPTIPGTQAWLASKDNDPTNIGSTAWLLAQSASSERTTAPHVDGEWIHHHAEWVDEHNHRHDSFGT